MGNVESTELRETRVTSRSKEVGEVPRNVDLLDVSVVLAKSGRLIVLIAVAALLLGGLVAWLIRPSYTATAMILPPQQQQSVASAMAGELGSLAGLSGGGASLFKNPGELYVGILQSLTITDHLVVDFHLKSVYHAKTMVDARAGLASHSTLKAEKDGLITISVTDHSPELASKLANGYVDELYKLNSNLAISEAAQRRVFFDQELVKEKQALTQAENELAKTQQRTGLIQLSSQAQEIIRSIAQLRAEIASREVEIQSLKTFATDQNADVIRAQQEIDSLRGQLAKLENNQGNRPIGDTQVPAGKVPEITLEYERKLRDVRYHEALYSLLTKQYEAARIDEAKSAPLIQVIDRAVPPDKKSGPHRALIMLVAAFLGFLAACAFVLLRNGYRRLKEVPENAVRLQELRREFRRIR
jgi:uncharacterized protein involved in exopolysaccharide biosynthesis